MAADGTLLQGEINESPEIRAKDVEQLLEGLLQALLAEARAAQPAGRSQ